MLMECDFNNLLRRYTTGTIPFELKKISRKPNVFPIIFNGFSNFSGTNSLQLLTDQDNLIHDKTFTLLRGLFGTIDILSH